MSPAEAHGVHALFEAAAMMAGVQYYRVLRRRAGSAGLLTGADYAVVLGCILGAALGNKLVFWAEMPHLFATRGQGWSLLLAGQSMVGGLLGGLLGVEAAKRLVGVRHSTGDFFVFPVLLALIIGRVGCFLAGLHDGTHGLPTDLPWGVDLGDGVPRHPAPLYEIGYALVLWALLARLKPVLAPAPGLLFKVLLASSLAWRVGVDFLKPVPYAYPLGLSGIQWVALLALAAYLPLLVRQGFELARRGRPVLA